MHEHKFFWSVKKCVSVSYKMNAAVNSVNNLIVTRNYFMHTVLIDRGTQWRSGWGTALQTGRSWNRFPMVSLEFFIYIILPIELRDWGRLSLKKKWEPVLFAGGKCGRSVGLTNLPLVLKSGNLNLLEPSGPVKTCNGVALPFYLKVLGPTIKMSFSIKKK
jgi:hypothetical protein